MMKMAPPILMGTFGEILQHATCYLLDPGTKLLFDIAQPGLIIHVTLPDKTHPWIHQSLVFFQFTSYVHLLTNVSNKLTNHYLYHEKQQI